MAGDQARTKAEAGNPKNKPETGLGTSTAAASLHLGLKAPSWAETGTWAMLGG